MTTGTSTFVQLPTDLAVIVWPGQAAAREVSAGSRSWESVSRGPLTMSAPNAEKARVLITVHQDVIVGAWTIAGRSSTPWTAPTGRILHKCVFELATDPRTALLMGHPSPQSARRNPVCLMQLRDVPGYQLEDQDSDNDDFGRVHLGQYTFTVYRDSTAELLVPQDGSVIVRPASSDDDLDADAAL